MSAEAAFQRTLDLNKITYEQESPLAKVKQLEEAGLSKSLMYQMSGGMGGAGSASSQAQGGGSSGMAPAQAYDRTAAVMLGMQSAQGLANIELTKAQKKNVDADTMIKEKQVPQITTSTEGMKLDNTMKELNNQAKAMTMQYDIAKAKSEAEMIAAKSRTALEEYEQSVIKTERDEATKDAMIKEAVQKAALVEAEVILRGTQTSYTEAQKEALAEQLKIGWANVKNGKDSNEKTAAKIAQDAKIWGEQKDERTYDRRVQLITGSTSGWSQINVNPKYFGTASKDQNEKPDRRN